MTTEFVWMWIFGSAFFYCLALAEQTDDDDEPVKPALVVGLGAFLAWPYYDLGEMSDQAFSSAVALSFGLFTGSLMPTIAAEPGPNDLDYPLRFFAKWLGGWTIQAIVMTPLVLLLALLSFWNFAEESLLALSNQLLPPLDDRRKDEFLRSLMENSVSIMIAIGFIVKLPRIGRKAFLAVPLFALANLYTLRSFHHLVATTHHTLTLAKFVGSMVAIDLGIAIIKAQISKKGTFMPPF